MHTLDTFCMGQHLKDTIIRSFKVTGISNAIDGTEDDFIWEQNDWLEGNSQVECGSNV